MFIHSLVLPVNRSESILTNEYFVFYSFTLQTVALPVTLRGAIKLKMYLWPH